MACYYLIADGLDLRKNGWSEAAVVRKEWPLFPCKAVLFCPVEVDNLFRMGTSRHPYEKNWDKQISLRKIAKHVGVSEVQQH